MPQEKPSPIELTSYSRFAKWLGRKSPVPSGRHPLERNPNERSLSLMLVKISWGAFIPKLQRPSGRYATEFECAGTICAKHLAGNQKSTISKFPDLSNQSAGDNTHHCSSQRHRRNSSQITSSS